MKAWLHKYPVIPIFGLWLFLLVILEWIKGSVYPLRTYFLGPIPWANMDGVHYLSIANYGYQLLEEAFFPLYPSFIRFTAQLFSLSTEIAGVWISVIAFVIGIGLYIRLSDAYTGTKSRIWAVLFLLLFPTSFFFVSVYTEGLFFFLAVSCLYAAHKRQHAVSALFGMLASATRLFGLFLMPALLWEYFRNTPKKRMRDIAALCLVPMGTVWYMWHLYQKLGDPLAFFHVQPAYGAQRSGESFIFLPQVLWRYWKIITTASPFTFTYNIALLELAVLTAAVALIITGFARKKLHPLMAYSGLVILVPTLTGTLSSLPRYFLCAFPLFFVLAGVHNTWVKVFLLVLSGIGFVILTPAFLQGYFVS